MGSIEVLLSAVGVMLTVKGWSRGQVGGLWVEVVRLTRAKQREIIVWGDFGFRAMVWVRLFAEVDFW